MGIERETQVANYVYPVLPQINEIGDSGVNDAEHRVELFIDLSGSVYPVDAASVIRPIATDILPSKAGLPSPAAAFECDRRSDSSAEAMPETEGMVDPPERLGPTDKGILYRGG